MRFYQKAWFKILIIFSIWKVVMLLAGYFGMYKLELGTHDFWSQVATFDIFRPTFKFDAGWYSGIAYSGYKFSKSAPAFYPVFPLLIATFTKVLQINQVLAAFIINCIAGYFSVFFLYKISYSYFKKEAPSFLVLLLFLAFPTSYFLHVMYGEAVFCALVFGAFYYARERKWLIANLLVGVLVAARLPGLVVAGAIGVEYLSSIDFNLKKLNRSAWTFLFAPVGFILYSAHLYMVHHDFLGMIHAYNYGEWAYQELNLNVVGAAWQETRMIVGFILHRRPGWQVRLFDEFMPFGSWVLLGIFTVWAYVKKLPLSYIAFMFGSFILFGIHTIFASVDRYVLTIFPIYILIAKWLEDREPWISQLTLVIMTVAMAMMYMMFVSGIWTA